MSYQVFFSFSVGLSKTLMVPKGTLAKINAHCDQVEKNLTLAEYKGLDDIWSHWSKREAYKRITDELLCETATSHNGFIEWLYRALANWSKNPVADGEELTPEQSVTFWKKLDTITVESDRWTRDYYKDQMEHLYEVMRGRPNCGTSFDEKALTAKQANNVIRLFSTYLDTHDIRLEVPNGYDQLESSDDGGYEWCEKCGPMYYEDARQCRKRKCPLVAEYKAEER